MRQFKFSRQQGPTPKPIRPSIVDGKLVKTSVSQIETFKACSRKWYFDKVEKQPRASMTEPQRIGNDGHAQYEKWLLTGEDVRDSLAKSADSLIAPFVQHAPFKGGLGQIEVGLAPGIKFGEVEVEGYKDFFIPEHDGLPVVLDWKFKSTLANAYGEEKLSRDLQANLYAYSAMLYTDKPEARFCHVTHQTKGHANAKLTETVISWGTAQSSIDFMETIVTEQMAPLAQAFTQDDVPYDTRRCNQFNTECPYAGVCNKSPRNRFTREGIMKVREAVVGKGYQFGDGETGKYVRELKGMYKFQRENGTIFSRSAEEDMSELSVLETAKIESDIAPKDAMLEELSMIRAGAEKDTFQPVVTPVPQAEVKPKKWSKKKDVAIPQTTSELAPETDLILIINRTITGAGTDLNKYVADLCSEIAARFDTPDIRLGDPKSALGFGGWKAVLGGLARERPPTGLCYISRSELNDPVIEALLPLAKGISL